VGFFHGYSNLQDYDSVTHRLLPDTHYRAFTERDLRGLRNSRGIIIGTARAMGLSLLAEPLSAERAEQWGLIWKAVDDERLADEALALARTLASGPTRGYGLLKKALYASPTNTLDAQLDLERDLQREAGFSDDYREGVSAFKEKRTPRFKGK